MEEKANYTEVLCPAYSQSREEVLDEPAVFHASTFFDDLGSSDDDLRNHIFLLTLLLAGHQTGHAQHIPADCKHRDETFDALSFLLSAGQQPDGANPYVATTGHLDRIYIFPDASSNASTDYEIFEWVPGSREDAAAKSVVTGPPDPDLTFEAHAHDLLTICAHLKDLVQDFPGPGGLAQVILVVFTLSRSHRRIANHILKATAIWGDHPISIIHQWYSSEEERSQYTDECPIILPFALSELTDVNLLPVDPVKSSTTFVINSQNIHLWTKALLNSFNVLQKTFIQNNMPRVPQTATECLDARNVLATLDVLIEAGVVDALLTPKLCNSLDEQRRLTQEKIQSTVVANTTLVTPLKAQDAVHRVDNNVNDGDETEFRVKADPKESPRTLVTRYLTATTKPYTAAVRLARVLCNPGLPPTGTRASLVMMRSSAQVPPHAVQFVRERLEASFKSGPAREVLKQFFGKMQRTEARQAAHAEATLMAAAYASARGDMETIFESAKTPIGVSKLCCYCCAQLGRRLNKWRGSQWGSSWRYPMFVLPGTHGVIRPWAPPPIGIPIQVLKEMREELVCTLYDAVKADSQPPPSTKTSTAHSTQVFTYDDTPSEKVYAMYAHIRRRLGLPEEDS